MGFADMISNALKGGNKKSPSLTKKTSPSLTKKTSPSLTSKTKTSESLVKSSGTRTEVRPSSRIPVSWNKDNWKCVNVIINGKQYDGYLWATDNWVEMHIFKNVKVIKGKESCTGNYTWAQSKNVGYSQGAAVCMLPDTTVKVDEVGIPHYPEYSNHVVSAIVNRSAVKYSPDFKKHYSEFDYWIDGTISVEILQEDIDRWYSWHPDNYFKTIIYERTGFDKKRWDYSHVMTDADVTAAFSNNYSHRR